LFILFLAQLFTAVGFSTIFPFLPLYVEELGSSYGISVEFLAGMVFSAQAITMMIASPIWGAIADRYGRKLMVERAMFGGAIILLLMAFVRSAEELVLLRAIQGLITGTIAAANALAASVTPRHQTGYAMGLLQVGMGSGVALGPLIGGLIADQYGYNAAFYVTSALLFVAGLLVYWGVEERFEREISTSERKSNLLAEWRGILTLPGVLPSYGMRFVCQLGRMLVLPIAPLFIQTLLLDSSRLNTFTGLVVGAASATTTISSVFLGRLGDRIGHRLIIMYSALVTTGLYLLHYKVTTGWQLLALQALVGVSLGGIVPSISALLAKFTPTDKAGAVYGLDNSIDAAGRSIAPLIGSAIAIGFGLRSTFPAIAFLFLNIVIIARWGLPKPGPLESRAVQYSR
jgi:DHA1 family multidrug resistance protein-like MFS transporter